MFYRLKSYLFHFSILSVISARLYQISSWGFNLLSFHDQTRNSFYANKKEPRVRTRFPLAEVKGFEPLCLLGKRFSRPPRYDRFDKLPFVKSKPDGQIYILSITQIKIKINRFSAYFLPFLKNSGNDAL